MNSKTFHGIGISLLIHGTILVLITLVAAKLPSNPHVLPIDFTLEKVPPPQPVAQIFPRPGHRQERRAIEPLPVPATEAPAEKTPQPVTPKPQLIAVQQQKRLLPVPEAINKPPAPVENPVDPPSRRPQPDPPTPQNRSEAGNTAMAATIPVTQPPAATTAAENVNPPSAEAQYRAENYTRIRNSIALQTVYPPIARRMGWEGKVLVSFTILNSGMVDGIRILESCGFSKLDQNAIRTIERCAPFPKPLNPTTLILPIVYKLQ